MSKPNKIPARSRWLAGELLEEFLFGLLSDPEYIDSIFFRNVSDLLQNYTVLYPRR
jgi:hypothetical protein